MGTEASVSSQTETHTQSNTLSHKHTDIHSDTHTHSIHEMSCKPICSCRTCTRDLHLLCGRTGRRLLALPTRRSWRGPVSATPQALGAATLLWPQRKDPGFQQGHRQQSRRQPFSCPQIPPPGWWPLGGFLCSVRCWAASPRPVQEQLVASGEAGSVRHSACWGHALPLLSSPRGLRGRVRYSPVQGGLGFPSQQCLVTHP